MDSCPVGQNHDADVPARIVAPQGLNESDVACAFRHEVKEDCVGPDLLCSSQPIISILNENDAVAVVLQAFAIGLLRTGVVVDEENGRDSVGVQNLVSRSFS